MVLSNVEPKEVLYYFEKIASIPHGSGNTKELSDFCIAFAKEKGLDWDQDELNNVIIRKPATVGYENAPLVMIQGHLDMVCEKEADCDIDFEREGLRLEYKDGILTARGTTLGGDDGIAIAYGLALLASKDIPHPALELICTVDEEVGMLGAAALDPGWLHGKILLNIDSEEEGSLLVSCAGGITAQCHLPYRREEFCGYRANLQIKGGMGGHSGIEIDKGRANANQILGRALQEMAVSFGFRIISLAGGLKDNAIARTSDCHLVFSSETEKNNLDDFFKDFNQRISKEYSVTDPGIHAEFWMEEEPAAYPVFSEKDTLRTITVLTCLPGGIQRMSFQIPGLVQTSLNMGILKTLDREIELSYSVRSSLESEKWDIVNRMERLMLTLGGSLTHTGDYPSWEFIQDSPLRELMCRVYEEMFRKKPKVQALHAGLECGLFSAMVPGLDCVSFGPDIKDIHTPKESMDIVSVERTWRFLLEVLKRLK